MTTVRARLQGEAAAILTWSQSTNRNEADRLIIAMQESTLGWSASEGQLCKSQCLF